MMGDDGEWQVASQNRRRRSRSRHAEQTSKPTTRAQVGAASSRTPGKLGSSYKENKNRTSAVKNGEGHGVAVTEERVLEEVRKLEHLMALLKSSQLWESLVGKLDTVLSTLNLGRVRPPGKSNELQARTSDQSSSSFDQCVIDRSGSAASEVQELASTPASTGGAALGVERLGGGCLAGGRCLFEMVCYGIGNFSESHKSRYQLALALCLRNVVFLAGVTASDDRRAFSTTTYTKGDLKPDDARAKQPGEHGDRYRLSRTQPTSAELSTTAQRADATERTAGVREGPRPSTRHAAPRDSCPMLVFDPVIGELETAVLEKLGCHVMDVNEQGKRCCCAPMATEPAAASARAVGKGGGRCRPTLFFMPHCPMRLYSNLLWANWSSQALGSTIVLGNSLAAYMDRQVHADVLQDPSNAIARAQGLIQELKLHPYPSADKARWKKDSDRLPYLELAFNDFSFSYSGSDLRESEAGRKAFMTRPEEFVEASEGELITGRASGSSRVD